MSPFRCFAWCLAFLFAFVSVGPAFASSDSHDQPGHEVHGEGREAPETTERRLIWGYDSFRGESPTFKTFYISPEIEVGAYLIPENPDIHVGRVTPIYRNDWMTLLAGGYYGYMPKKGDHFLIPALYGEGKLGCFHATFDLLGYLPLTGQETIFYSDDTWIGYRCFKNLELGISTSFLMVDGRWEELSVGPEIRWNLTKRDTLGVRWMGGIKGESNFRVQYERKL